MIVFIYRAMYVFINATLIVAHSLALLPDDSKAQMAVKRVLAILDRESGADEGRKKEQILVIYL